MTPPPEKAVKAVSIAGIGWSYFMTLAICGFGQGERHGSLLFTEARALKAQK